MARNGSGTYSRVAGTPYTYNTVIDQVVVNSEMDDIATALTNSLAKNGETTPTANLPMGTFKHTGVGEATARTDYARASQVQDSSLLWCSTAGGTADAFTLMPSPAITAYAAGQAFHFLAVGTNTGAVTVNISGVGAKAVQASGSALAGGEIVSGKLYSIRYDGTQFQLECVSVTPFLATLLNDANAAAARATLGAWGGAASDIASAGTVDLTAATGNIVRITGTTATSAWTISAGQRVVCVAVGAWPLTYHATNNPLPGSTSYTCAAGDVVIVSKDGNGTIHVEIVKRDGTAIVASASAKVQDFRLTLTSGTPVTTADVTGATTIYCAPYKGNQISLYDGAAWNTRTSAEFSLALSGLTSGKPYDVFCYDNSGTPTLEALVWTNDTTRATALAYQDGVLVKSGDATRRYLGTFYTTSTTTTEDSEAKRFLWNYYHRVRRSMKAVDATATWTYTTATIRQARASSANQLDYVCGLAEDEIDAQLVFNAVNSTSNTPYQAGIGVDSTTTFSGLTGQIVNNTSSITMASSASYHGIPGVGRHFLSWNEVSNASGTCTWTGSSGGVQRSGIHGSVFA